jgi:phage terminase small subunit
MYREEVGRMALTAKQKRFCEEYLIDLNATQAAIRAGYKQSDYTDTNANKLLENTSVAETVAKAMAERSKRCGISQDRVVNELAKIAFLNVSNLINTENGTVKDDATEDDLACIQSVKVKTSSSETGYSEEREVKVGDKLKALELLGKHLGMFKDNVDVNLTVPVMFSGEDQLEE